MSTVVFQEEPRNQRNETKETHERAKLQVASKIDALKERFRTRSSQLHEELIEDSFEVVGLIVDNLTEEVGDVSRAISYENLRNLDVGTMDIERDCDQLKTEVQSNQFNGKLPCIALADETLVPISLYEVLNQEIRRTSLPGYQLSQKESVLRGFGETLRRFIAHRVASRYFFGNARFAQADSTSPQLPVNVFSPTTGARVSYTPAYFINYVTFGAPTSPARGMILPGRYLFKLTTMQGDLFDRELFDIPPSFDVKLMV